MKHLRFVIYLIPLLSFSQQESKIIAYLHPEKDQLKIEQSITIINNSNDNWDRVVLLDWANSFSSVETALADRFAQDFKNRFQFSSDEDRGRTVFSDPIPTADFKISRVEDQKDIVELLLDTPLLPGASKTFILKYDVEIPNNAFTGYGKTSKGDYNLQYWYLHPAVYHDGKWDYYSHKDLNDFYGALMDFTISLHVPSNFHATSSIPIQLEAPAADYNSYLFEGTDYNGADLYIRKKANQFKRFSTTELTIVSDLEEESLADEMKVVVLKKISKFLTEHLGAYPHDEILISNEFYKESPVYGLSSLPSFINPFPDGFGYEIRMLKAMTRKWVQNGYLLNSRKEFWLDNAITIYTMMKYQEMNYPDLNIVGKFSKVWGLRGFNVAKLKFNDQYSLLFLNTARLNLDQALTTPADSLVKYNQELGLAYKAGVGFLYLDDYLKDGSLDRAIKKLYNPQALNPIETKDFRIILNAETTKDTDWFFDDYITSHVRMDWKIRSISKSADSLTVKLKNKSGRMLPVPLYTLNNDSIVSKEWIPAFARDTTITLSRKRANRLALNYEQLIPEFSQRDNYRTLKNFPSINRPLQLRLFKDVENPAKTEVFLIPDLGYNLYDGVSLGARFYNGNLLPKPFNYSLNPTYGFTSRKLIGSVGFSYSHPIQDRSERLYEVRYGLTANTFSYEQNLLYRKFSSYLNLSYRPEDLRSNKRQRLTFRNVLVSRERSDINPVSEPDYNVFNINWSHSDPNFRRYFSYGIGTEISTKFGKIDGRVEWRKLFKDNRQLNIRVFAGAFLYNDTGNDDFFSYALDRPTDYLFDYNYYGRSEDSGLFSQQLIVAEGGFKSQLEPTFANKWITTANASYSIWKYIYAYGDIGLVKNSDRNAQFVYDSGVRVNLLQDYFELYFPLYSNKGWEIAQKDYDQKIRFIVTLDINTFINLFKRRWY
ncbi:gluzincin family metallopeptidase [Nonlabens antarcticus]|uniref:aminopeptidase n=1 Tax=Nonlabens antarcticus TaxID=392714 RepID=UPI0018915EB0|nr:aminopeptidase [Nonlabens antarcticus]